ncbi:MAG: exodeoxyribonuclease VII large subunit [Polyangiaceae bacterium]|nr:exodeoxyribonuclease VII large subunit [Polyangiaceae bacterium]
MVTSAQERVITVAELSRLLKHAIEGVTGSEWVEGEVASFKRAASGHVYFSLRDEREDASVDCVMYRLEAQRARGILTDGARVQLLGRPTLWAPRGRLQFAAMRCRPAGRGALLEALQRLRQRLASEGLFAEARKRPLPARMRILGVVTSAHGAAFQDICAVAFRRGGVRIVLSPALVQGEGAPESIVRAMDLLERYPGVQALIVGRGGGSSDELMAFNDERVVRRIAAYAVPVISAVGHDVDFTLADLVADVRAATPSQAAELVIADNQARVELLSGLLRQLTMAMRARIGDDRARLQKMRNSMSDPRFVIVERQMALDDLRLRAERQIRRHLSRWRLAVQGLSGRVSAQHPRVVVARARTRLDPLKLRLRAAGTRRFELAKGQLADRASRLEALSPLAVLARGYALVTDEAGRAVRRATDVAPGDRLEVRVARGRLRARVVEAKEDLR